MNRRHEHEQAVRSLLGRLPVESNEGDSESQQTSIPLQSHQLFRPETAQTSAQSRPSSSTSPFSYDPATKMISTTLRVPEAVSRAFSASALFELSEYARTHLAQEVVSNFHRKYDLGESMTCHESALRSTPLGHTKTSSGLVGEVDMPVLTQDGASTDMMRFRTSVQPAGQTNTQSRVRSRLLGLHRPDGQPGQEAFPFETSEVLLDSHAGGLLKQAIMRSAPIPDSAGDTEPRSPSEGVQPVAPMATSSVSSISPPTADTAPQVARLSDIDLDADHYELPPHFLFRPEGSEERRSDGLRFSRQYSQVTKGRLGSFGWNSKARLLSAATDESRLMVEAVVASGLFEAARCREATHGSGHGLLDPWKCYEVASKGRLEVETHVVRDSLEYANMIVPIPRDSRASAPTMSYGVWLASGIDGPDTVRGSLTYHWPNGKLESEVDSPPVQLDSHASDLLRRGLARG